jgi:hypothetical protein
MAHQEDLMDEQEPIAGEYERGVQHGRRLGAYAALTTARRALRQTSVAEVARILNRLVSVDDLGDVLRRLEDAADRAVQGGEQP